MRLFVPVVIVFMLAPPGCGKKATETTAYRPGNNLIIVRVDGMVFPDSYVRRVRQALGGLAWVDQESVFVDPTSKLVSFEVDDVSHFNEPKLLRAFRKEGFADTRVLMKPRSVSADSSPEPARR